MNPPAPKPVSWLSQTNDVSTAQIAASTALPPARSTCAPASAVSGWPAATTPFMARSVVRRPYGAPSVISMASRTIEVTFGAPPGSEPRHELGDVDVDRRPLRAPVAPHPRLAERLG